jgi:hypothetical protein
MAARTNRRRWGAFAKQRPASQDDDPAVTLYIAIVERAQADLRLPVRNCGGAGPTTREKDEALQFLTALKQSATRRLP